jgi:phosphoserine aminotransferase
MARAHNFFAGPAVLPLSVVEETAQALNDFGNLGVSIMEVSHRSKEFEAVSVGAANDALQLMGLSADEYAVIFVGGGASTQFAMVPMNFLQTKADYLVTGEWATKAAKEARLFGEVVEVASSKDKNFNYIPKGFAWSADADYAHITTNNTIFGTQLRGTPDVNVPLVADMSSDMLSRPMDFAKYSLIYAGAQKNLGPSGVTMIVVKKAWMEAKAKDAGVPTMLKYKTHVAGASLYNTPPTLPIFVLGKTLRWIMNMGGLEAVEQYNETKAKKIYDAIDAHPDFYKGAVPDPTDRSRMNITWNLPTPELEDLFVKEAKGKRMLGLKGHRSVGGLRASVYNACPMESIDTLVEFMEEFYTAHK